MHIDKIHVTPESGSADATVPSNSYLDGAGLTSSGVSTGLAGATMVVAYAPGFLASLGLPLGFVVPAEGGQSDPGLMLPAVFLFGLLGFGLGTLNLVLGLRKKARCRKLSERAHQVLCHDGQCREMLTEMGFPVDDHPHTHDEGHSHEHAQAHVHEHASPSQAQAG